MNKELALWLTGMRVLRGTLELSALSQGQESPTLPHRLPTPMLTRFLFFSSVVVYLVLHRGARWGSCTKSKINLELWHRSRFGRSPSRGLKRSQMPCMRLFAFCNRGVREQPTCRFRMTFSRAMPMYKSYP